MKQIATLTAGLALLAAPLFADDITDTLNSAITAYEDGDIEYAIEELTYAKGLLQALKTQALEAYLPEAPAGWTREIEEEAGQFLGMMGGGTGTQATYTNGSDSVDLMIMVNNPMVTAFGGMISNAAMLGMKVERVGRQKFLYDDGQLTGLIDGRILVQAEGRDKATMLSLVETMDFQALADFGD